MAVPTIEQREAARERANAARLGRYELLRGVRSGETDPCALLADTPECLAGMFAFDFLREVPRVGRQTVREINRKAVLDRVNLAVSLGDLGPLRRRWLTEALRNRHYQPQDPVARRPQG